MDCGDSDGESSDNDGDVDSSQVSSSDSDTPSEREPMPKKQKVISSTRKYSGSARYSTTYQSSWEKTYDFVMLSSSKCHFYCKVCRKDMSIKHQGALEIQRDSEGKSHKQRVLSARSQTQLSFKSTTDPIHDRVTAAGVRNTVMLAHHNAALCLADHIGPMQRKNFPDSEVVKYYHCAQTKTA